MKRVINRLKGFDFKRMIKMVRVVSKRSNHSFLWVFLDIFRCWILFGSGYMDYYLFYFEDLTDKEKSTYINQAVNKQYIRSCNDPEYYHILNDKGEFLKKYKEFINRDFIDLRECSYDDYVSFVNSHSEFIVKPVDGLCGKGVELINSEGQDLKKLYTSLYENDQKILEEKIKQNKEVSNIYAKSINTIRIVTLNKNDEITIMFRAMRIGNNNKVVDNFNNGGLMAVIDEDGVIRKPILDKDNKVYESHPMTNTKIVGFNIPRFNEIIELCNRLARVTPELGLCGWDIAVTEDGLDVVEGNHIPGYDIYQSREQIAPSKEGLKKFFDDAIYPERKNKKVFAKGFNIIKLIWVFAFSIIIQYLLNLIHINIPFVINVLFDYLVLYKNIDKRKFNLTIFSILIFNIIFAFIPYGGISFNNFLLNYLVYALINIVISLFSLYFYLPFIDKIVESLNKALGIFFTCLVGLIDVFYIATIIYIIELIKIALN